MGIESFLQTAGSNANGNGAMTPSGTFAGLSCVPGNYGGTWNGGSLSWPNGKSADASQSYDFWSPLLIDYGDTYFGNLTSSGTKWAQNAVEAIAYAIIKTKKNKSPKGQLDCFFISDGMYQQYLTLQRTKERIEIYKDAARSPLVSLGFTDVVNQDGTDVTWEYGTPAGLGYGFNCDQMELRSQQATLFVPEGPDFDIASKSWRWSVDFFGNAVWNPKFFAKLKNYTTTSDTP
jgi:hypothetical protein